MKSKRIIYLMLVLFGITAASCKKDQPEVETTATYPLSGEWYVRVYNADGTTLARPTYTTLNIYNTSDNVNNVVWVKMLTSTVPFALLGKASCDVGALTIGGTSITNMAFAANPKFTISEGKVMLAVTKLKSKVVADSIYVKYTTETNGNTYILSGHRRSQYEIDQY